MKPWMTLKVKARVGKDRGKIDMSMSRSVLLASVAGAGVLAVSTIGASAAIVCSGNVCWHTTERYEYPPDARVTIREDTWKPAPDAKITFREHSGRGYWRDDKWVEW
jgi:hypothetical protein